MWHFFFCGALEHGNPDPLVAVSIPVELVFRNFFPIYGFFVARRKSGSFCKLHKAKTKTNTNRFFNVSQKFEITSFKAKLA